MGRASKITSLPDDVRRWLERALTEQGFSGYEQLVALMAERGYQISKSALHRYGQKIERRFAAIKSSTEAARLLTEGAADDQDARSEAVIALVQTEMFESIINLQEAGEDDVDPAERMVLLGKVARNMASLTQASVRLKKFQAEVREKIAQKLNALHLEAISGKGRAFDAETLRIVREEIYGIVG
jgi:Protein of unknown function (DUF3486)